MGTVSSLLSCGLCFVHPCCRAVRCGPSEQECCRWTRSNRKTVLPEFSFSYLDSYDVRDTYRVYWSCVTVEDLHVKESPPAGADPLTHAVGRDRWSTVPEGTSLGFVVHDLRRNLFVAYSPETRALFVVRMDTERCFVDSRHHYTSVSRVTDQDRREITCHMDHHLEGPGC